MGLMRMMRAMHALRDQAGYGGIRVMQGTLVCFVILSAILRRVRGVTRDTCPSGSKVR